MTDARDVIAARAAQELRAGEIVNLGIGIPNRIPGFLDPMIRGGHIDTVVLGALQISETGDIANWMVPGGKALGVGGAMDLVVGAKRVIVTMTALTPDGEPKLIPACTFPLTAVGVVKVVITEHAVFRFVDGELVLTELLDGATEAMVAAETSARYRTALA